MRSFTFLVLAQYNCEMNFRKLSNSMVDPSLSKWCHGLAVRTLDFESNGPSSNLGGTFFFWGVYQNLKNGGDQFKLFNFLIRISKPLTTEQTVVYV